MYTLENLLTEKTSIADDLSVNNLLREDLLIPDNYLELIIPLDGVMEIQMLGTMRRTALVKKKGYFVRPRGRGMKVFGSSSYLLIKCNPSYTKSIIRNLTKASNGIYEVHLEESTIDTLTACVGNHTTYVANNLLEAVFDLSLVELNPVILNSIELIRASSGSITIKDIYTELSISKSTLEQRFMKDLGLTPKEFCKIEKLNHFIRTYCCSKGLNLTEITYQCGYYDQSHLIKDFNYFLNMSPKRFFQGN